MITDQQVQEIEQKINQQIHLLHHASPDSIGDLFHFCFIKAEGESFTFQCATSKWMQNAYGTLHGGIIASIMDQAMGFIASCLIPDGSIAPTIQMQQCFHRPLIPGESVYITVKCITSSGSFINMQSEIYSDSSFSRLCATSTAIYFLKHP